MLNRLAAIVLFAVIAATTVADHMSDFTVVTDERFVAIERVALAHKNGMLGGGQYRGPLAGILDAGALGEVDISLKWDISYDDAGSMDAACEAATTAICAWSGSSSNGNAKIRQSLAGPICYRKCMNDHWAFVVVVR